MPRRSAFTVLPFATPGGGIVWRVRGSLAGRRIRKNYADEAAARAACADFARQATPVVSDHRAVLTWLTAAQVRDAEHAQRLIGTRSLVRAGEALAAREPVLASELELPALVAQFLRERRPLLSPVTHDSLEKRLGLMMRATGVRFLHEFTLARVEPWVHAAGIGGLTKVGRRAAVTNLASWLAHPKRRLVPKDLLDGMDAIAVESEPPRRLTAAQVAALMRAAAADSAVERIGEHKGRRVRMLHNYALRTFAGLRPSEVLDLAAHPERINLGEGYVFVGDPRTRTHRAVKLTTSARAWLRYCAKHAPEIVFKARLHERIKLAAGVADVWQPDICRHTFGSFCLRRTRNVHTTAEEMGNSPRVVRGFYAVPLTDAELRRFDALRPPSV